MNSSCWILSNMNNKQNKSFFSIRSKFISFTQIIGLYKFFNILFYIWSKKISYKYCQNLFFKMFNKWRTICCLYQFYTWFFVFWDSFFLKHNVSFFIIHLNTDILNVIIEKKFCIFWTMIFFICFHVMFIISAIFQKSFKLFVLFVMLIMNKTLMFFSYWHENEWSNLWSLFWSIICMFIIHTVLKNSCSYWSEIKNWNVWDCIHSFNAFINIFCFWRN